MQGESLKSTENCNLPKTFQTSITTFSLSSIRYYLAITLLQYIIYLSPALFIIYLDFLEFNFKCFFVCF